MNLSLIGWLFALGVTLHNVEEAIFLPKWSAQAGRWHSPVQPAVFRFAVAVLSIAALLAAWLAAVGGPGSFGAYFIAGYALAMGLNVLAPHLAATLALRKYAPGTATGLLFNLPLGGWLLYRALMEGYVDPGVFLYSGPLTVLCILASIPLLFALGRKLNFQ
jgi:hypothetical protein